MVAMRSIYQRVLMPVAMVIGLVWGVVWLLSPSLPGWFKILFAVWLVILTVQGALIFSTGRGIGAKLDAAWGRKKDT